MKLSQARADLYIPDEKTEAEALARVTHMAVGAHQDDIEFMAWAPIRDCLQVRGQWFCGVTCTDGAGSPRAGKFKNTTDKEMVEIRRQEQRTAAEIGRYAAQFQLDHPSKNVKKPNADVVADLQAVLRACRPRYVYTHNPADKHDSHVAVMLRLVEALRGLEPDERPETLTGCEVWRSLDWLNDEDKVVMNQDGFDEVENALMTVYESQIEGGKRYDLGTHGRRRANATYFASHGVDEAQGLAWGIDLTALITQPDLDPVEFVQQYIQRFSADVAARIKNLE